MEGRTEGGPEPPPPEAPVGLPVEAPEWPPYCDPTYVMPSTIQVYFCYPVFCEHTVCPPVY